MARPGTFKPGNKLGKGRPKLTGAALDARELARQYTREAIEGLHRIATDPEVEPGVRARCWDSLLDRGHGKPAQALDMQHTLGDGMGELLAIIRGEAPKP